MELIHSRKDLLFTEIEDGTGVLLDLGTKMYFSLNATAALVWQILENRDAAEEELVNELHASFEVTREQAQKDLAVLLDGLEELSFVERVQR